MINTDRPKRGIRALTDAEEWQIYRDLQEGKSSEELAVVYGVRSRTIENAKARRQRAIDKGEQPN